MALLSREAILQAEDLPRETVHVPEWGGSVFVRAITGEERDTFEAGLIEIKGKDRRHNFRNMRARLVALSVCDAEGQPVFTEKDVALLGRKAAAALDRVFAVAQRLAGLREEDVEELGKPSESDPSESSRSA